MRRAIAFALVAGCAHPTTTTPPPANIAGVASVAAFAPPALYAALFELGHVWSYAVVEDGQVARTARCMVTGVVQLGGGVASQIACEHLDAEGENGGQDPLTGVWVATSAGVYYRDRDALPAPGVTPPLVDDDRVLPATLADHVFDLPRTGDDGADAEIDVYHDGEVWCSTYQVTHGNEAFAQRCFSSSTSGIVRGSWGYGRGNQTTFTLAP